MKSFSFSEFELSQVLRTVLNDYREASNLEFTLNTETVLLEEDVCRLLRISPRTLRTYRKKGYIRSIQIEGRNYFLRPVLFLDFLSMYDKK